MATKCANCPLRAKDLFTNMTADEVAAMQRFKVGELAVNAGTPLLLEGSKSPQLYTVLDGIALRSKVLSNGDRQVINIVFAGDFLGLQSALMGEMGHSVDAVTDMTLCVFDRAELTSFFQAQPKRAFALTWLAATEEHFLGEVIATLGQRTAEQAVAWALLKVFQRGQGLGLVKDDAMALPIKQRDLADALGLSLVHTNKTIARLRDRQLLDWSDGKLRINDLDKVAQVALQEIEPLPPRPLW